MCGSETFAFLKRWVPPAALAEGNSGARQKLPADGPLEQLQTYEQLLKPDRRRSRKRSLIARGAFGLAILGAARLVWHLGKTSKEDV